MIANYLGYRHAEMRRVSDLLTAEARGEANGEERGISIGEARALRNLALAMKADNMPVDNIAKLTNLTKAEINAL